MTTPNRYYSDKESVDTFFSFTKKGSLLVGYFHSKGYEGMALAIMIVFDTTKSTYDLDLQWMSLGLDPYGDTLQESYVYRFADPGSLLNYLHKKYTIKITDIPVQFKLDNTAFPNPVKDADKKQLYEDAWKKFQQDFRNSVFLDPSLPLIYNSLEQ